MYNYREKPGDKKEVVNWFCRWFIADLQGFVWTLNLIWAWRGGNRITGLGRKERRG